MECVILMFSYIIKIDFYWKDELWDESYSLSLSSDLCEEHSKCHREQNIQGENGFEYTAYTAQYIYIYIYIYTYIQ